MAEVSIPYRDGPLDGERELLEEWELAEGAPGAVDGYVYEHRPSAWPGEVHRYRLTRDCDGWEFRYIGEGVAP